ncbi:hypothetical protein M9458_050490, partial [Cirrhinus mrigala]
ILRLPHVSAGSSSACPTVRLWFVFALELEGGQRGHGAQPHLHRAVHQLQFLESSRLPSRTVSSHLLQFLAVPRPA